MKSLVVNKKDLIGNIEIIKEIAKNSKKNDDNEPLQIIAVVKGNGYGLGLVQYSNLLIENGINFLAVATVEEAIKLREEGITTKILMMSSTSIKEEVELLIKNDVVLTVGSIEAGDLIQEVATNLEKKVNVHLKIDTGFGRYGFCYDHKEEMIEAIKKWNNINIEGTFSHLSLAFYKKDKFSKKQFERFIDCVKYLKENEIETGMLHICNSSAFLKYEEMRLNAVRIGSAFLGRLSIPNTYGLKKIGYLKSNITEIKELSKGYNIGYSNSYITKKRTTVATIPVGYADGYNVRVERDLFRKRDYLRYVIRDIKDSLKNKFLYVEINGQKCKVLGRLGMYHVTIDITNKNIKIGDEVLLNICPFYVDSSIRREYR